MKVFKFGGASVNSAERIRNLAAILYSHTGEKILVVVSAMGKTTNALEKVVENFYSGRNEEALKLFGELKQLHLQIVRELLDAGRISCEQRLVDFFTEVEWMLHDQALHEFDYYYDQVVCCGELLSSSIISAYLEEAGVKNIWMDARDLVRTDDNFRDAAIDWEFTKGRISESVNKQFSRTDIVLTQGFIGATDENESTTLGREGSDYSAAVFANILNAESLTIWKDVEAIMNADPRQFKDVVPIPALDYNEVIEMAYYGAQVIHPKTIKPLQNKIIPLFVKCFLNPALYGTKIHDKSAGRLPPIIVRKENQVMVEMKSRDYSFIGEKHISYLYQLFEDLHIKPNLTQNAAISFVCVLDDRPDKIEKLLARASVYLDVRIITGLSLLTIRHYHQDIFDSLVENKSILLRQQTPETLQVLMANKSNSQI